MSRTTFTLSVHLYMLALADCLLNTSRQQENILNTCSNRELLDYHQVAGHPHYTWSQRKLVTGSLVGINYHSLNNITSPEQYPIPHLHDFTSTIQGATIFSKLNLVRTYHQIPVEESSIPKIAITTPFGLFEFLCMPFGLRNAAQTFQRFIDEVLQELPFCYAYINDVLIASKDAEEHKLHLKQIFQRFTEYGILLNPSKCEFGMHELTFLGHCLNSSRVRPVEEKLSAIKDFSQPSTQRKLRQFLGLVNFYHRFIPHCAHTLSTTEQSTFQ